jgi:hypothetical protein
MNDVIMREDSESFYAEKRAKECENSKFAVIEGFSFSKDKKDAYRSAMKMYENMVL